MKDSNRRTLGALPIGDADSWLFQTEKRSIQKGSGMSWGVRLGREWRPKKKQAQIARPKLLI
jgi:hypothetical protein